jgi:hypothetical protein
MNGALALRQATFVAARLGIAGWIGALAIVLAALAGLAIAPGIERGNAALADQIAAMKQQLARLQDPKAPRAGRDPVADLLASLPAETAVAQFVASVQQRADQGAVEIDRTEYRTQPLLGNAARRYHLTFPAHADYVHLRQWLEGLLHDYPNLTLDELTLRREVDGGEELEANIAMSFLVRVGK